MLRPLLCVALLLLPAASAHAADRHEGTLLVACVAADTDPLAIFVLCGDTETHDTDGGTGNHTATFSWPDAPDLTLHVCLRADDSLDATPPRIACTTARGSATVTLPATATDTTLHLSADTRYDQAPPHVAADATQVAYVLERAA